MFKTWCTDRHLPVWTSPWNCHILENGWAIQGSLSASLQRGFLTPSGMFLMTWSSVHNPLSFNVVLPRLLCNRWTSTTKGCFSLFWRSTDMVWWAGPKHCTFSPKQSFPMFSWPLAPTLCEGRKGFVPECRSLYGLSEPGTEGVFFLCFDQKKGLL